MVGDYISREAAIKRLDENLRRTNTGSIAEACYSDAIDSIRLIPAADVVAVVRCRECVFGNMPCATARYPDYFCADGKRKDGGKDE